MGQTNTTAAPAEAFVARWERSASAERANYQSFLIGLCKLLGVPDPDPAGPDERDNAYVFERAVTFDNGDGTTSPGRIDLYKRGCFVLEAKQGSAGKGGSSKLGSSKAGKQMYDPWIKARVQKALDENLNTSNSIALNNQKNGPLLAAVFSTDLTGARPELAFKVQTYPNIKSWGAPFE